MDPTLPPAEHAALLVSHDGQWCVARDGRTAELFGAEPGSPPVGRLRLEDEDADLALVGTPAALVAVTRRAGGATLTLHHLPYLDEVARHELDAPFALAAVTGARVALTSPDGGRVLIARAVGRALTLLPVDLGAPAEFVVGLERGQLLFGLPRKLEAWDAASGRPVVRLALPLPPAPRVLGVAAGHLWAHRPGGDELFVFRLSDGRPFRHYVGAAIARVVCHPASPIIVVVTPLGLVRLHCFAHSLTVIDAPPAAAYGLAGAGEDAALLGRAPGDVAPWRLPLAIGAPREDAAAEPPGPAPSMNAADRLRHLRDGDGAGAAAPGPSGAPAERAGPPPGAEPRPVAARPSWRDALATFALELSRGLDGDPPVVGLDTELGDLAQRLGLSAPARRALAALYALYLIGEPALPISRLARAVGGDAGWVEALGRGDLGELGLLDQRGGRVALAAATTRVLDGEAPRGRLVGGAGPAARLVGAHRVDAAGRPAPEVEAALGARLGRVLVIDRATPSALVEASLHGAVAVTWALPRRAPAPWPRGAGLVLVTDGAPAGLAATLPALG